MKLSLSFSPPLVMEPMLPGLRSSPRRRTGRRWGVIPASLERADQTAPGPLTGVWLSRYEFFSSGRDQTFESKHHVLVVEREDRLTVESLPGASTFTGSSLSLDLARAGNVITGSWREQTGTDGYYRGAVYHGAVQMIVELTGRRMAGKWVGFGKDFDVNTGPW